MYIGDQKKIERIQRRATRHVAKIRQLSYQDRLKKLSLPCLVYRRKRDGMITMYKIMTGKMQTDPLFEPVAGDHRTRDTSCESGTP